MATKKKTDKVQDNIIDLDLSVTQKQKYRINGESGRILELNIQDMNMPSRFFETEPKIDELLKEWSSIDTADDEKSIADKLKELDDVLRTYLDYIFDTNLSEVVAPSGSMFDFINGKFRFEHILEVITNLYQTTIQKETQLMLKNMSKHTGKYQKNV